MATFDEIERKMREENFKVYLIGLVRLPKNRAGYLTH